MDLSVNEIVVTVFFGLLPSLTWMIFYLQEDSEHPEPLGMIVYTFILGGLITFFVLAVQYVFRFHVIGGVVAANHPVELFVFSAIEEIAKFLAVFWFISKRKEFNEPLDAMIYMVVCALGFAAVENVFSIGQQGTSLIVGIDALAKVEILALRFFGATLLHSLTAAIIGYHWGWGIFSAHKSVARGIAIGLSLAILVHTAFNWLIIATGPLTWVISFVVFVGFFVMANFEDLKERDV